MIGANILKWMLVMFLFVVLPIMFMRYMVQKTVKVVEKRRRYH